MIINSILGGGTNLPQSLKMVALKGTETFTMSGTVDEGTLNFRYYASGAKTGSLYNVLTDRFITRHFGESYGSAEGGICYVSNTNRNIMFVVGTDLIQQGVVDIDTWKSYLRTRYNNGNPLTIVYQTA